MANSRLHNIPALMQENSNAKDEVYRLSKELEYVMEERKNLEAALEECKGKLWALQPVQPASELDLVDTYGGLCDAVEDWVEEEFGDVEDLAKAIKAHPWKPYLWEILQE